MTSVQLVSNEDPRLIPAWAPDTLYAVGHQVIAPTRTLVEAKVEHTSGATYEAEHWQTPLADVTTETARAETAETVLTTAIASEATTRATADSALSAGITSAISTAEAASDAVGTAATDVAVEKTRALAAEGALSTSLSAEVTNRTAAVTAAIATAEAASDAAGTAATDVATEKTRALAAEALLIPLAQRGAANGVPTLDGEEHLTLSQVPPSVVSSSVTEAGEVEGTVTPEVTTRDSVYEATQKGNLTVAKPTGWPAGESQCTCVLGQGTGGHTLKLEGITIPNGVEPTWATGIGAVNIFTLWSPNGGITVYLFVGPAGPVGAEGPKGTAGVSYYPWSMNNLLGWSFDPISIGTGVAAPTAGQLTLTKIMVSPEATLKDLIVDVTTAGAGLTSGECFGGVFSSTGALLGVTADQHASWESTGTKTMELTAHETGTLKLASGITAVYGCILTNGTTEPVFGGQTSQAATAQVNAGLAAANLFRGGTILSGQTTIPSGITIGSVASSGLVRWMGVN